MKKNSPVLINFTRLSYNKTTKTHYSVFTPYDVVLMFKRSTHSQTEYTKSQAHPLAPAREMVRLDHMARARRPRPQPGRGGVARRRVLVSLDPLLSFSLTFPSRPSWPPRRTPGPHVVHVPSASGKAGRRSAPLHSTPSHDPRPGPAQCREPADQTHRGQAAPAGCDLARPLLRRSITAGMRHVPLEGRERRYQDYFDRWIPRKSACSLSSNPPTKIRDREISVLANLQQRWWVVEHAQEDVGAFASAVRSWAWGGPIGGTEGWRRGLQLFKLVRSSVQRGIGNVTAGLDLDAVGPRRRSGHRRADWMPFWRRR